MSFTENVSFVHIAVKYNFSKTYMSMLLFTKPFTLCSSGSLSYQEGILGSKCGSATYWDGKH